ncbi:tripartite motif-containing protein 72-like [Protopterus annectens]|uniref:tripartite motif-containing protein 72-like n=1 Tax=Protopterus annectens TaxID=7888 RepID=UPI001CFBE4FC|nr:tripartite motif-containing protein 72-like [Protopterus annectens]
MSSEILCQEHGKPLDIFCTQENVLICLECSVFGKHQRHRVIRGGEAQQKIQEELKFTLQRASEKREKKEKEKENIVKQTRETESEFWSYKDKVSNEINSIREVLDNEEQMLHYEADLTLEKSLKLLRVQEDSAANTLEDLEHIEKQLRMLPELQGKTHFLSTYFTIKKKLEDIEAEPQQKTLEFHVPQTPKDFKMKMCQKVFKNILPAGANKN